MYEKLIIKKQADILVVAIGKPKYLKADMVKDGAIVIDVGINFVDGKMCGDVAFDQVEPLVAQITPVPGGVGGVTSVVMADHVVRAAKKAAGH